MIKDQHLGCFSGGESSALVAVEVFRKYGNSNLILLNHDIKDSVENSDIKRFKNQVSSHIGVPVTYANMSNWDQMDQFDVVVEAGAFKVRDGSALCTSRMKTRPFYSWLKNNQVDGSSIIYYGFDKNETARIQRRNSILATMGYRTEFPLAFWPRTIASIRDIGIEPPLTYEVFKHANCTGCLKAGLQHWYVVFCTRPDIWNRGIWAEDEIGYSIIKGHPLADLKLRFELMRSAGVPATELLPSGTFWKEVRKRMKVEPEEEVASNLPCECVI